MVRLGVLMLWWEAEEMGPLLGEEMDVGRHSSHVPISLEKSSRSCRHWEWKIFSLPGVSTSQQENSRHCHELKWEASTVYRERLFLFSSGDRQAVEQVTQRGCACSVLGRFCDITEWSREQPDLTQNWLCFEQEVGLQNSSGAFPPNWFCKIESLTLSCTYIEEKCCLILNLTVIWEN